MVHNVLGIFSNKLVWTFLTAWFVAQALKIPTYWVLQKKLDFRRFFGAGGMPSSHTAMVVSLAITTGGTMGFDSVTFAITMALAFIVMYDASGVRYETGKQAVVINEILRKVFIDGKPISDDELKEVVGHTHIEVVGGFVVGVLVALLYLFVI